MTRLYLVRHGQTDWNAKKLFQGSQDIPLNDLGRQQAQEASKKLAKVPFAGIYSSQLKRAQETAEIIKGDRIHPILIEKDLRESSFGSLEGQRYGRRSPWDDLHHLTREQRLHHKWVDDQESAHEVMERVVPCLTKIGLAHPGQDVLIVTHGGIMRTLLAVIEKQDWNEIKIYNTHILIFKLTAKQELKLQSDESLGHLPLLQN